jgi:tetratricopeptide (TPR) repeat protein
MRARELHALFALLIATGLLFSGAARAQGGGATPGTFDRWQVEGYQPNDAVLARMNAERALDVLKELIGQKARSPQVREAAGIMKLNWFIDRREISSFRPVADVRAVEFFEDRVEFKLTREDRGPTTYYFHEIPSGIQVVRDTLFEAMYGVPISKDWVLWCSDGGVFEDNRAGCAKQLADALYVLRKANEGIPNEEERFKDVVAKYRALGGKVRVPEEVRRFQVQADFMIQQKRYGDAIRIYGEGLKIAPWWPDGHFNRALLLAESKRYRDAIIGMNRFLLLEPDSPDARTARDRVYQWEAAMKMGIK